MKQRELQPWTAKINKKQAEIDVATSEREMLAKKAEAAKAALDEAKQTYEQLQEDQTAKVSCFSHNIQATFAHLIQVAEVDELKSQRTSKVQELRDEQRRLQVCLVNVLQSKQQY